MIEVLTMKRVCGSELCQFDCCDIGGKCPSKLEDCYYQGALTEDNLGDSDDTMWTVILIISIVFLVLGIIIRCYRWHRVRQRLR